MSEDSDPPPLLPAKPGTPEAHAARRERVISNAVYSAERSLMAWVRTGLSLMTFGFVMGRFGVLLYGSHSVAPTRGLEGSQAQGTAGGALLIGVGGLMCAISGVRYVLAYRQIMRGEHARPTMRGPAAVALGSAGIAAVAILVLLLAFVERAR